MKILKKFIPNFFRKWLRSFFKNNNDVKPISMDPSAMWGRIFNLEQKQLLNMNGFDLYVMPDDYIGYSIIHAKIYEPHITKLIKNILNENDVFLDIGANIGYFTMLASSIIKTNGKVIAFEPNPQNLQLIYSSMQQNKMHNIDIYPYAVSNNKTILRFANVGSNGVVITEHAQDQKHFFFVQSVMLDTILKDEPCINLIKIDVEAHEPYALEGMKEIIKKHRPKILTEFHPWAMKFYNSGEPINYLESIINLGYKLSIIKPDCSEIINDLRSDEIMSYWKSLNHETIHLDLYAQPI